MLMVEYKILSCAILLRKRGRLLFVKFAVTVRPCWFVAQGTAMFHSNYPNYKPYRLKKTWNYSKFVPGRVIVLVHCTL